MVGLKRCGVCVKWNILHTHIKKKNTAICSNLNGLKEYCATEIIQIEKDKYSILSFKSGV